MSDGDLLVILLVLFLIAMAAGYMIHEIH